MSWLSARLRAWADEAYAVRPTLAGGWYLLVLAGVTFGAVNTGNNMVYVVLATLLSLLIVNNVLAEWNLRGLVVRRSLPSEVFAGEPASGRFAIANRRRYGAAWRVEIEERGPGAARAILGRVGAGEEAEVPAVWSFAQRGPVALGAVRVASRYPFGLVLRYRDVTLPAELLVYPASERGAPASSAPGAEDGVVDMAARKAVGDFIGLRPYHPGDPVRRIHWPSSARAGEPLVVMRSGERGGEVMVRVDAGGGERAIRRACGQVLLHARRGDAIGLEAGSEHIPPRTGPTQRRRLLTTLALLP